MPSITRYRWNPTSVRGWVNDEEPSSDPRDRHDNERWSNSARSYVKWIRAESSEPNPDYVSREISAARNPFLCVFRAVFSHAWRKSRVCTPVVCVLDVYKWNLLLVQVKIFASLPTNRGVFTEAFFFFLFFSFFLPYIRVIRSALCKCGTCSG